MHTVFEKIIEKLEEEKMSYFLTIANTGDEKLDYSYEQVGDALDKAIEIVKQEAEKYKYSECGFVSKSDVLKVIEDIKCNDNTPKNYGTLLDIMRKIRILPTVRYIDWIPCSDRLPECENKYGWVSCIVSVIRSHYPTSTYDICDSPYDENIVMHANYHVSQKIWHLESDEQLNALIDIDNTPLNGDYVIAWQPLPEPYQQKGE